MWQVLVSSLILSVIHGLIPNHWIPLITISKTEKWTNRESVFATMITGFAHTLSTIIVGVLVGFAGYKLSESYSIITHYAAPTVLVVIGLIYLILDFINARKNHSHDHFKIDEQKQKNKSKTAILTTLAIAMFLSPCIEIEAYYFQAGTIGWLGILIVSTVYLIVTIFVMCLLVYLGLKGLNKFNWHFLEHHEKRVTGIVLLVVGIISYFIEF